MFMTTMFFKIKQLWDYLVYPSKYYAKKYAKKYVEEYSKNKKLYDIIETDDSRSDTNISDKYSYNDFYSNGDESVAH